MWITHDVHCLDKWVTLLYGERATSGFAEKKILPLMIEHSVGGDDKHPVGRLYH